MRKGFTIIEVLVVLAIITIFASLLYAAISSGVSRRNQNQAGHTSKGTSSLEVADGPLNISGNYVFIIKDNQTEKEFILVDGGSSVAIAPVGVSNER